MKFTKDSYFLFSGGEVHSKVSFGSGISYSSITCLDYTMNGFMALCEYREVLRRNDIRPRLIYPYLPYARQDRVIAENEPFSLKIFCDLLNSQDFQSITIVDPHSDVVGALIDNCNIWQQWTIAQQVIPSSLRNNLEVIFVSPDAGAYKKLSKLMPDDNRIAIGVKKRDASGKITHTNVFSPIEIAGRECVIVDDICDGGRTFIELAKELKNKGAQKIYLYVTHGIFPNGFGGLKQYIDHIYTTNSFPNISNEFLTVVDVV